MIDTVIVSACLAGVKCRYDGGDCLDRPFLQKMAKHKIVPLCPEQLGGLPTPRPPAGIDKGNGLTVLEGRSALKDTEGLDVTENFIAGAKESLKIARLVGATKAFLKEKSPSCGVSFIKRKGEDAEGPGVTTALFIREGLEVVGVQTL